MGYSISTPIKSARARDIMLGFLETNMRPWSDIQPVGRNSEYCVDGDFDWTKILCRDGELAYDKGKARIGFNYGLPSSPMLQYAGSVLRWIALKVGRKREFPEYAVAMPVPYTVYDGDEKWPVLVRSAWETLTNDRGRQYLTDELGFKPSYELKAMRTGGWPEFLMSFLLAKRSSIKACDETARKEMARLDGLWKQSAKKAG